MFKGVFASDQLPKEKEIQTRSAYIVNDLGGTVKVKKSPPTPSISEEDAHEILRKVVSGESGIAELNKKYRV